MASIKASSRYPCFDSRSSTSDPSSSSEFKTPRNKNDSGSSSNPRAASRALVRTQSSDLASGVNIKNEQKFSSIVKKFMEKKSKPKGAALLIPSDFIAEDLKKTASKGSNFSSFHRKLLHKGFSSSSTNKDRTRTEVKALTEVKSNTRTLAMVLRSERELLNQNKDYETEISELKLMMEEKTREVEKLKDLCLKQREEIKALKTAILFPDVMNSQLQGLLEKQGSELQHTKQVIPTLQRQVTSLTGQLQCLADDLAEVKADKYAVRTCLEGHINSPGTPIIDQEATNSLEFSSEDRTEPGSPDDMFLKDFNPCLTPYSTRSKCKEIDKISGYDTPQEAGLLGRNTRSEKHSEAGKTSKSSEYCQRPILSRTFRWSNENKCNYLQQPKFF